MSKNLEPVREWRSVHLEHMQIKVRAGQWIQLVAYPNEFGDEGMQIVQLVVSHDGRIELTSDTPSRPWNESRSGPAPAPGDAP